MTELTIANITQEMLPIAAGFARLAGGVSLQGGFGSLFMSVLDGAFTGRNGEGEAECSDGPGGLSMLAEGADEAGEPAPLALADEQALLALFAQAPIAIPPELAPTVAKGALAVPGTEVGATATVVMPGPSAEVAPVAPALAETSEATPTAVPIARLITAVIEAGVATTRPPAFAAATETVEESVPAEPRAARAPASAASPPPLAGDSEAVVRIVGNGNSTQAGPQPGDGESAEHQEQSSSQSVASSAARTEAATAEVAVAAPSEAAPERTPRELPEAVRQVGRETLEQVRKGGGETHIRLDPPELGQVTIQVRQVGGRVELDIVVQRPEAAQLLRDHAADLAAVFGRNGLELHVQVGLGGHRQPGEQQQPFAWMARGRAEADGTFAELLGIDPAATTGRSNRARRAYNPDGRHLYRV